MALESDVTILTKAPLFGLLEPEAVRLLAFASETRNLRRDEVLFKKGDRSDGAYIVIRGALALEGGEVNGQPFIAEPGALVGHMALFLRTPRPATATACDETTVMRISPTLLRRVLEEFPRSAGTLYQSLSEDLAGLTEGLERVRRRLEAVEA
ncbi:MAG TPA: Crp/Fnr family transcriptional regulator [Beijerinckiaceae bacterium]|jgi:CRP-like cAMP-binding protein